jgi:hypothetical protein
MHMPATDYPLTANDDKTYQVPRRPAWCDGAPPGVGWWPANAEGDPEALRWWNGQAWSLPANPRMDETMARDLGARARVSLVPIKWSAQWWLDQ